MKYPHLFQPIMIGNTLFKNRIFSAPTGHPNVSLEGAFTEDAIAYYERKARGGAAVVTLGETIVDSKYGKRHTHQISLDCRNSLHTLSLVADRINRHGAIACIELQHSGIHSTPGLVTPGVCTGSEVIYGPSAGVFDGVKVEEMPEEIILEVIEKFGNAAKFVKNCGFGMVTIHGGHGWLVNEFLCERLNQRTDKWGGSVENRARLAIAICDDIHRKCGKGFPIEMRLSASEVIDGGYSVEEAIEFARLMVGHADIIHCSVGCGIGLADGYRTFSITHPSMFREDGMNVKYAAAMKKAIPEATVATVGALSDPDMMEQIIASGQADIVEMARGLICDPDLPNKAMEGKEEEITHCMRCFNCFSSAKERGTFWCALNPETNRERAFSPNIALAEKKKVLVVGGGIAGMQAALTAAENGHQVILCEKTDKLGGHIRCEENVPFKKHLKEYLIQQERKIEKSAVDVRLNTEVTHDYAKEIGADVIIAALGARPVKPSIPGIDGDNVYLADDVYLNPDLAGKSAVILGGGLVGMELAIYLHSLGVKVEVVEMAEGFHPFPNILHGQAVNIQLREDGISPHFSTKAIRIDDGGVWCETTKGEQYFHAESVIYAVGQRALSQETMELYDCAPRFYPVGDCVLPRNIAEANITAKSIAQDIGRY